MILETVLKSSHKMSEGISETKIPKNVLNPGKNRSTILNYFLKFCFLSHLQPLKCAIRPFKMPCFSCELNHFMESIFLWFMIWLTLFYNSVENGWNKLKNNYIFSLRHMLIRRKTRIVLIQRRRTEYLQVIIGWSKNLTEKNSWNFLHCSFQFMKVKGLWYGLRGQVIFV